MLLDAVLHIEPLSNGTHLLYLAEDSNPHKSNGFCAQDFIEISNHSKFYAGMIHC